MVENIPQERLSQDSFMIHQKFFRLLLKTFNPSFAALRNNKSADIFSLLYVSILNLAHIGVLKGNGKFQQLKTKFLLLFFNFVSTCSVAFTEVHLLIRFGELWFSGSLWGTFLNISLIKLCVYLSQLPNQQTKKRFVETNHSSESFTL